jgi:lysophospholipase L1-like esterase
VTGVRDRDGKLALVDNQDSERLLVDDTGRIVTSSWDSSVGSQTLRRAVFAGRAERAMFDLMTEALPTVGALTGTQSLAKNWYALTNPGGAAAVDPNAPFEYAGAGGMQVFVGSNFFIGPSVPSYTTRNAGSGVGTPMTVRFMFDGTSLNIGFKNYSGYTMRLWVNGKEAMTPLVLTGTPATAYLPLTFAGRAPHLVEVMLPVPFFGVFTDATDTVWKPAQSPFRIYVVGDSYVSGTGASDVTGLTQKLAEYLGTKDVYSGGEGGSGWNTGGSAPGLKFRDRINLDLPSINPDIIVLAGGHNDATGAALQTEVAAAMAQVKALAPNAYIVVVGPLGKDGASNYATMQSQIFANSSQANLQIDTLAPSPGWLYGTGRVGATSGVGNDDFYINTDNVHPTVAGHDYLGRRIAQAITNAALRAA